jgi:hypothetical protein
MKILSDPDYLIAVGVSLTLVGGLASGVGTFFNSKHQANQQKEMTKRADEQSESQRLLRVKSDEIAGLNHQIAESQTILRTKADTQVDMQLRLTDKSEEIALLNSQMSHIQERMREKTDLQLESQRVMKDLIEENALVNSQIVNYQKESRTLIGEIRSKILSIDNALNQHGIITETNSKTQNGIATIEGVVASGKAGVLIATVSSSHIKVQNGQIEHFGDELSIFAKITGGKQPYLHAKVLSPSRAIARIDTDKVGFGIIYGKFAIRVSEITSGSAIFVVSAAEASGE